MRRPATESKPAPTRASTQVKARPGFPVWLMAVLLGVAMIAVFWPATRCGFINFDDDLYVTSNVHVQNGLTLESIKWAFLNPVASNWHPITMLSHMLDCQLFGLNPWGHHLTSVLLHAFNAALVFTLLQQLTGATWRSLFVAALFAVHPLRVESVAWVAERKDVLSGFFGFLTLIFYARYARKRTIVESREPKAQGKPVPAHRLATLDYGLALFFFVLGLMSKSMLVTWPFVMLLLDYWPLGRFKQSRAWQLVTEKIPFLVLAAVASGVTLAVQHHAGAMATAGALPFGAHAGNALISYCRYLGKLFWPANLAVFYPYPGYWPMEQVLPAGLLIVAISVILLVKWRGYPFLLMGWLWFCGTLVPVIGLVQVGDQAMADRYMYIPSLGMLIFIVWGGYELTRRWRYHGIALSAAGSAAIVLCAGLTRQQLGYWQDSETLFRHALVVTKNNYIAYNNLGTALYDKGRFDEAISQYQEAIRLAPDYAYIHYNLGTALDRKGQFDEAISQYQEAIRLRPDNASAHKNLGNALYKKGRFDEAISQYQEVIRLRPDNPDAHYNLGTALYEKGQLDEAISQFEEVIHLKPDHADAHNNLGTLLLSKSQIDEAISEYQEAVRLRPNDGAFHDNLGIALDRKGQTDQAISEYKEAIRLNPDDAKAQNNLTRALKMKNAPADR